MAQPLISVVMPCHNAALTIEEAIDSIRGQSLADWELIILDDGSSDNSLSLAEKTAREDARIRVLSRPHRGIVPSLREACGHARGSYIARMDADDISLPQRLSRQHDLMRNHPEIGLCGCHVEVFGPAVGAGRERYETWLNQLVTPEDTARELFVECPIAHPAFFMRNDLFRAAAGYQDNGWAEDYDLCMRFFLAGIPLANVPEPLLRWRDTPERLSMQDPRYGLRAFRDLKRHYLARSYLPDNRPFYQWGAGEVGKVWLREWGSNTPCFAVDINPRKLGRAIHGIPVVPPDAVPPPGSMLGVVAVGAPGARDEIRAWYTPRGYQELRDFLFVA